MSVEREMDCPACGEKVTAEIGTGDWLMFFCPCGKKYWETLHDNRRWEDRFDGKQHNFIQVPDGTLLIMFSERV